nr:MAG TPA: hypothetical protein [Caudoviricetes sp.]
MYTFIRVFELIVLQKYTNYMGAINTSNKIYKKEDN